jgi:hypothetical protein
MRVKLRTVWHTAPAQKGGVGPHHSRLTVLASTFIQIHTHARTHTHTVLSGAAEHPWSFLYTSNYSNRRIKITAGCY